MAPMWQLNYRVPHCLHRRPSSPRRSVHTAHNMPYAVCRMYQNAPKHQSAIGHSLTAVLAATPQCLKAVAQLAGQHHLYQEEGQGLR